MREARPDSAQTSPPGTAPALAHHPGSPSGAGGKKENDVCGGGGERGGQEYINSGLGSATYFV